MITRAARSNQNLFQHKKKNYNEDNINTILEVNEEDDHAEECKNDKKEGSNDDNPVSFLPDINSKEAVASKSLKATGNSNRRSSEKFSKSARKMNSGNLLENFNEESSKNINFLQIKSIYSNFTPEMRNRIKEKGLTSNDDSEPEEDVEKVKLKQKIKELEKIRRVELSNKDKQLKRARNAIKLLMRDRDDPLFDNPDDFIEEGLSSDSGDNISDKSKEENDVEDMIDKLP